MNGAAERMERVVEKTQSVERIEKELANMSISPDQVNGYLDSLGSKKLDQKVKIDGVLRRPHVHLSDLRTVVPQLDSVLSAYDPEIVQLAETDMKYAGYIQKEQELVDKMTRLEQLVLNSSIDYHKINSLSAEAREKLTQVKPRTIGQASRISGVSPSDISVLLVHVGR